MHLQVTTAPATQAVSDAEAVAHAKIDSDAATSDSALINDLVLTAIRWAEEYCNRSLVTQTITLTLDSAEFVTPFHLPLPPFGAITSFNVYDEDDTATEITSANYRILGDDPARIEKKASGWTLDRDNAAAIIVYTAGYGAASAVPEDIKAAIRLVFTDLYENRQNFVAANLSNLKLAESLLDPYRIGVLTSWT